MSNSPKSNAPQTEHSEAAGCDRLDQWFARYLKQLDEGESLDPREFLAAHPELADELCELIEVAEQIDRMAGPVEPTEAANAEEVTSDGVTAEFNKTVDFTEPKIREPAIIDDALPRRFGEYELLEVIGHGGMGVVYLARQATIDRRVAVKMILNGQLATNSDIQRFYNEARAAGRLSHANIVTIYEVGQQDGHHFFSMDFIEGESLADMIRRGPLDPRQAAEYLKRIAEAIHFAHEHGILHRDLKPANVLIDAVGQPHITDFGLAKDLGHESELTKSGTALGTPSYMPPEQASGRHEKVSRRSDVYSLGAILYAMLTGCAPFRGESAVDTIMDVIHKEPPTPRLLNASVDRTLETICMKCMQKKPAKRYPTAIELAEELDRYLRGQPIHAKPIGWAARCWIWLAGVPLIAAATGVRAVEPSINQRRFNAALMLLPMIVVVLAVFWFCMPQMLPRQIRIASAARGGVYYAFAKDLADHLYRQTGRETLVLETSGSVDNAHRLAAGAADVALLQENAIESSRVAVVAPLYFDAVHVVVRSTSGLGSLDDFAGRAVSLGPPGSGMRLNALKILERHPSLTVGDLHRNDAFFTELLADESLDAAIITTGQNNGDLQRLLATEEFEILPIGSDIIDQLTLEYPSFRPFTIRAGSFVDDPGHDRRVPPQDIRTVATTTFLAVERTAKDVLVTTVLETLYADSSLVDKYRLINRRDARRWSEFALHPAAHAFFAAEVR